LQEKNSIISKNNIEKMQETLEPFKEQIKELNNQIVELKKEQSAAKENFSLQVSKVIEQTNKISVDADNLSSALKGNVKSQGIWGEQILEKTLEESGLRKNKDYVLQKGFKSSTGKTLIPDAVIYLPANRNIIIDSKVSLTAYSEYINSENEDDKKDYLKQHIHSLKEHLKSLSDKRYENIPNLNPPDYILIFVPIESALSLAISNNWELQRLAMQHQIGFVSPINLIAILRMAENLWRLDAQNENAEAIAKRAGHLIDKFSGLSEDISNIGKYIRLAERSFEGAENKLSEGKGNLFDQIKELERLGAKSKKIIDEPKNIGIKR
jgi:DNA recombination protein RmuC